MCFTVELSREESNKASGADAVIENLGVSLLPRFTLEEALREKKVALFSVKGFQLSMLMQVIYSKNRWVSPAMKAFIEMTQKFMPE